MKNLCRIIQKNGTVTALFPMFVAIIMNISCFISTAFCAENDIIFTLHKQIIINEHGFYRTTMEYPRLILYGNKPPLVSYVDNREQKAYFTEINDDGPKILATLPMSDVFSMEMLHNNSDKNYFSTAKLIDYYGANRSEQIMLFLFDRENKKISLQKEYNIKISGKGKKGDIDIGLYPFKGKFLVFGGYEETYFHPLGFILGGHMLTGMKHFSAILDNSETVQSWPIDEEGRYHNSDWRESLSEAGTVQVAWVREKAKYSHSDETICYSESEDGMHWKKPMQIYTLKEEERKIHSIRNLSMVEYKGKVFIFWRITEKGEYLAEIEGDKVKKIEQISDTKREQLPINDPVGITPAILAVDQQGNLYVLSVVNSAPKRYRMFLKARINGEWTKEAVISEDTANFVQSVDLKIDVNGIIHIVYYLGGGRASYYMKVTRN